MIEYPALVNSGYPIVDPSARCDPIPPKGVPRTSRCGGEELPAAGKEAEWSTEPEDDPAPAQRRVLVVGAGPAGLEAAWVAAARGHQVRAWDRAPRPGGRLNLLRHMPQRRDFHDLIDYQTAACRHYGAELEMGREADARSVTRSGTDAVVLADYLTGTVSLRLWSVAW